VKPAISMNGFQREPQALRDQQLQAVQRVFESGWYVLGTEVEAFEKTWAETTGTAHAVGVGNGLDALEIGMRTLGIGPGDEVITTPMTAFASILAILRAGATPVLADIEADTALLSMESVKRCLSDRTRAVVLVHLYGRIADMTAWVDFCDDTGLLLVEDCAQAHLAQWNGRCAGSFGAFGAFSFYPTKNLGAIGDAGAIVSDDYAIVEKARRLRNYGQSIRYQHPDIGMNSRLDELQAAILRVRLSALGEFTKRRREVSEAYRKGIKNPLIALLSPPTDAGNHVHHLFVIRCAKRDELQKHLASHGIESLIHYPIPVHHQAPCAQVRRDPEGLPESETHASVCLSIPCHPQLTAEEVKSVVSAINAFS
jgi:dTDP-4-amino-4,6-dideoxygalactose transaminase